MTKWQEVKLGDVCDVRDGTHDTPKESSEGKYLVTSKHIKGGKIDLSSAYKISLEDFNFVNQRSKVDKWDILISMIGTVGEICLVSEYPDFAIKNVGLIKTGNEYLAKYLYYYLKSSTAQNDILSRLKGTTQQYLSLGEIRNFPVIIPPIDIQKKIAGVLGALDDKIELNNKINNNLEQQAQAVFLKAINSNNFDNKLLSEVATIKYGKGLPTNKLTKVGYKVFGGNGIIGYYTEYLYKEPQILISCRGAASGTILESHPYSYITNNSLIVELNDRRYYEFLKQYFSLNQLHSYATGSAQPQITIDNLKTVEVPYPNYEVISDINAYFTSISDKIYENICENEKLAAIRDALLPKLMSSEIDVSNVDISALTSTDKLSFRCRSPPKNISYRFSCYFPLNSVICDIFIRQFVEFFSHISSLFLHYLLDIILFPSIHCVVLTR